MIKHERWHILVALGVGALLVIVPSVVIGVLGSMDKMEPGYYMYLALVPMGIFSVVRGFMFISDNRNIKMLREEGAKIKGSYISHGTKHSDRQPLYYVRYSFEDETGQTVLATSPAQYTWEQALAFRAAQEFTVLYKDGKYMIGEDAARLFEKHFEDVTALKKAYNEAFNVVYRDLIEEAEQKMRRRAGAQAEQAEQAAEEGQDTAAAEDTGAEQTEQAENIEAAEQAGQAEETGAAQTEQAEETGAAEQAEQSGQEPLAESGQSAEGEEFKA